MNIIWTSLVVLSLSICAVTNPNGVLTLCVDSATQALQYALQLVGVYALWLGVFSVAERCNLVEKLAKVFEKLNGFLYGNLNTVANKNVSLNMASNLLGVGNAATPSAIEAIKNIENDTNLSRAGAMLFVLNANGIQLIPTTVMGLRASCGSQNASDVLLPTVICTFATAVLGVFLVGIAYGKKR